MTAKECLKHPWLANNKKKSNLKRTTSTASILSRGRVGCSSCSNSNYNQQNLRKYLSKSREALFEKVISKHKQHSLEQQSGPNLRKSTLLSQYDKTRRMCESQMSLVSKSRERLMQGSMSPSITRSREKLYGIKSLSKSHEVLNLTKTVSALASMSDDKSSLEGLLKTLTRAATASGEMASLETIEKETEDEEITNTTVIPDKPDSNNIKIAFDNSTDIDRSDQSKDIGRSILNISETTINADSNIPLIKMNDEIVEFNSDKQSIAVNLKNSHQNLLNQVPKEDKNIPLTSKMVLFQKQLSVISSEGEDTNSSALSQPNSLSLTEDDNLTSDSDLSEDQNGSLERITGDDFSCVEDDEPRFTVKQLISAYNMHQEIVTKTSLEVTMNANDPEQKILPVIDKVPNKKFPTGPNALRLFIPDIQITKSKRTSRRKNLRKSNEYVNKDNSIKEEEVIKSTNLENFEVLLTKENIFNETVEHYLENTNSSFNNITNDVCLNNFCKEPNSETDTALDFLNSSGQIKSNFNFEGTSNITEDDSKMTTNTYQDILTSLDQKSCEDEILSYTKEEAQINISGKIENQKSIILVCGKSLSPERINNNADFKTNSTSTFTSKSGPRVIIAANKSSVQNDNSTSKTNSSKEQIDLKKDKIHNEHIFLSKQNSLKEITDSQKDIVHNEEINLTKRHSLIELNNESQVSRKDSTISNNEKFSTCTTKSTKEISPTNLQCGELGSMSVNSSSADIPLHRRNRPNRNSRTETNFSLEPMKDSSQSNELRIFKSNRNSTCSTSPHDSFAESLRKSSTSIYNNSTKNNSNATPRMNRKSFPCATRSTVASTEKTRRKSNPAMKPPFY